MTRHQEDNIMGWLIIMMIVLFVGATCQASKNLKAQESQAQEGK
jgi:hypothetical protein